MSRYKIGGANMVNIIIIILLTLFSVGVIAFIILKGPPIVADRLKYVIQIVWGVIP
jgi:hypothetical protein